MPYYRCTSITTKCTLLSASYLSTVLHSCDHERSHLRPCSVKGCRVPARRLDTLVSKVDPWFWDPKRTTKAWGSSAKRNSGQSIAYPAGPEPMMIVSRTSPSPSPLISAPVVVDLRLNNGERRRGQQHLSLPVSEGIHTDVGSIVATATPA